MSPYTLGAALGSLQGKLSVYDNLPAPDARFRAAFPPDNPWRDGRSRLNARADPAPVLAAVAALAAQRHRGFWEVNTILNLMAAWDEYNNAPNRKDPRD